MSLKACTCGFAKKEREALIGAMKKGKSDDDIIAGYVQKYGLSVLTVPPKRGFFHVGYWIPLVALVASFIFASLFVFKRSRRAIVKVDRLPMNMEDPYAQKLKRALEESD